MKPKNKTKRRKVWVNQCGNSLGDVVWESNKAAKLNAWSGAVQVPFIELHHGDVVLSSGDQRNILDELKRLHDGCVTCARASLGATYPCRTGALIALLRGSR